MAKINLPRQDHYDIARDAALEELKGRSDPERLRLLGAAAGEGGALELACLAWRFGVELDPLSVVLLPDGEPCGIVWQILILNYLCAQPPRPPERFVSFADFEDVRTYLKPFEGRVIQRLVHSVGQDRERLAEAAQRCAGRQGCDRPLTYLFNFFPQFELQVVHHEGDEDFPPSCNVLFPDNALELLTAENMIVAAELLVSSLKGKRPCD